VIIGFGRLGRACAEAALQATDLELVGVVVAPDAGALPAPFRRVPVAAHVRELAHAETTLLCVPAAVATGVARELLQQCAALVECARFGGNALAAHYEAIGDAALRHGVPAVVGAGWDPGVLPLLRRTFEWLIPEGHTEARDRPGASLHHSEAARLVPGVVDALATEARDSAGSLKRYVYVELAALESASRGIVLERLGTAHAGAHQALLLEARFDPAGFAARVMLDAARRVGTLRAGAHQYSLWP
jgi:diaminopimelate dehydrogenase